MRETYLDLEVESVVAHNVTQTWGSVCNTEFVQWAEDGLNLVIGAGIGYQYCLAEVAKNYSDTDFFQTPGVNQGCRCMATSGRGGL